LSGAHGACALLELVGWAVRDWLLPALEELEEDEELFGAGFLLTADMSCEQ
jgi:hypothetical protein